MGLIKFIKAWLGGETYSEYRKRTKLDKLSEFARLDAVAQVEANAKLARERKAQSETYCPIINGKCVLEQCTFWRERATTMCFVEPFPYVTAYCALTRSGSHV